LTLTIDESGASVREAPQPEPAAAGAAAPSTLALP
jgi:hypothetical protein